MIPFGEMLRLWRLHRGLTQEQLARRARMPRPNLTAVERGRREVSLSTLRALALALDVNPGLLVDGTPPPTPMRTQRLSREALERIAGAVARGASLSDPAEAALATSLRRISRYRARVGTTRRGAVRHGSRLTTAAWLSLRATCSADTIQSLLDRIENWRRTHASQTD